MEFSAHVKLCWYRLWYERRSVHITSTYVILDDSKIFTFRRFKCLDEQHEIVLATVGRRKVGVRFESGASYGAAKQLLADRIHALVLHNAAL